MEKYDYREAVKADIREWLQENRSLDELKDDLSADNGIAFMDLYDEMFCVDSITGNASGSYTFSRWQAEENLCHNLDLLEDAQRFYDIRLDLNDPETCDPETCDVTIRVYLLNDCLYEVLEEIKDA